MVCACALVIMLACALLALLSAAGSDSKSHCCCSLGVTDCRPNSGACEFQFHRAPSCSVNLLLSFWSSPVFHHELTAPPDSPLSQLLHHESPSFHHHFVTSPSLPTGPRPPYSYRWPVVPRTESLYHCHCVVVLWLSGCCVVVSLLSWLLSFMSSRSVVWACLSRRRDDRVVCTGDLAVSTEFRCALRIGVAGMASPFISA